MCPLGYRYGFHHALKNGITAWRCFSHLPKTDGKTVRCPVRLRSKMINGYEMIESIKHHEHTPQDRSNVQIEF